jgi:protein O-GlcNAc transferase
MTDKRRKKSLGYAGHVSVNSIRMLIAQAGKLLNSGNVTAALPLARKAVAKAANSSEAYHLLGICSLQSNQLTEGVQALQRAASLSPNNAMVLNHLGIALSQSGNNSEAIAALRKAVELAPALGEARNNLAHALNVVGDFAAAAKEYQVVISLAPGMIPAWHGLPSVLHKSGDYPAALDAAHRATARFPEHSQFFVSLGHILFDMLRLDEAEKVLRQALAIDPRNGEAANSLGTVLEEKGAYADALTFFEIATTLSPNLPDGWYNLGNSREKAGELLAAEKALDHCLRLRPTSAGTLAAHLAIRRKLCAWQGLDEQVEALRQLINDAGFLERDEDVPAPFSVLSLMLSPAEQLAVAKAHSRNVEKKAAIRAPGMPSFVPPSLPEDRKLHIGYLSPDFREHPIAQLMAGVIESHDREAFVVSSWSLGPDDGSIFRDRIVRGSDRFVDIREQSIAASVAMMRAANLDIMVDLAGYTAHARPEIAALRVALVQVNYLGFPGSMGAAFMDYILVDPVLVRPEDEHLYSEKVIRLPDCYQANDDKALIDPAPVRRSEHGLPEDAFVFCCFSMNYKIDGIALDAWTEILHRVPDSVLWLPHRRAGGGQHPPGRTTTPSCRRTHYLCRSPAKVPPPCPTPAGRSFPRHLFLWSPYHGKRRPPGRPAGCDLPWRHLRPPGRRQYRQSSGDA